MIFNKNKPTLLERYKYSLIDKIIIKIHTRALGVKFDRLFVILPVLITMSESNNIIIENVKNYLTQTIKPLNLANKVYDRVILRLLQYRNENELYLQDRQKMLEILSQNIQLYVMVDEIFAYNFDDLKKNIEDFIKKQYDEAYKIDDKTKILLAFQEKYYLK